MVKIRQASEAAGERGRWSSRRKQEVVLRVLRGEDLDALSRELGVTAGTIARWRDQFLAGGQAAVKSRPADERDDEIARLRAKVGELTMENALLRDRARRAEAGAPFGPRRSRP
jgi:transposase-like protein